MDRYVLTVEDQPSLHDVHALRSALSAYNVSQIGPTDCTQLAVFVRDSDGQVTGGVYGEVEWGWLYIDLVWLHASLRGRGMGARMVGAMEQGAFARGAARVYMATTSFQALPFYQKIGYEVWSALDDRPPGHRYYYLRKPRVEPRPDDSQLIVEQMPSRQDRQALVDGLRSHMRENGVALDTRSLAVFVREPGGAFAGGLYGRTYWGWFDLMYLWVAAPLRRQGYGARLLALAEHECVARGIHHIVTDATSFHALSFYHKQGFDVFGTLEDRPPGHTSYFLKKQNLA